MTWKDFEPAFIERRYDRLAGFLPVFEWIFGLPRGIRQRAVAALQLRPGDRVLEVGCGTGRVLPALRAAVGDEGRVYGVDLSAGMLARARALCERNRWGNVILMHADGARHELPDRVHGVIFSLSYATMPHHREVLRHAWAQLVDGGRLVIMDAKVPSTAPGRLIRPWVTWISRRTVLGNPDIEPWVELRALTDDVEMTEEARGTYYICVGCKRAAASGDQSPPARTASSFCSGLSSSARV